MLPPLRGLSGLAVIGVVAALFTFAAPVVAQEEYTAQTTRALGEDDDGVIDAVDDLVSAEKLSVEVKPLTKAELEVELMAWLGVLKARVEEVSALDIAVMEQEGAAQEQASDAAVAARAFRDEVIRRVNVVIASLADKGGETEEAEQYVDAVAGLPPVTGFQAMWINLRSWLLSKDGGLKLAINVGLFLLFVILFRILAAVVGGLMDRALGRLRKTSDLLRSFLVNTSKKVIFFIGVVIALSYLGVNIGPFVAAIGAAGFVIGFALQGTLSNFAAGVMVLIYRPYDVGDVITAAGITGKVDSMNLVSTTIKTADNQSIVVPNGSIWGGVITNITANPTRRVDMTFGIGYGDDIGKAKQILLDVCDKHELTLKDPAPVVEVGNLGESSVDLLCRPWAKTSDYWAVYWDLMRQVKERFDQAGINIPFPQRDVHVYQHAAG